VHTGTPHQEQTVLDVAESLGGSYPLVILPTAERTERGLFISLSAVDSLDFLASSPGSANGPASASRRTTTNDWPTSMAGYGC